MTCQHAQHRNGGTHCHGGAMDGRNVSPGICKACRLGRLNNQSSSPCHPHATFCARYGLPTSPHACEVCTAERETDPEFGQHMRAIGMLWGAMDCRHRIDTGRTEQRTCCGGKVKDVTVWDCAATGGRAACDRCDLRAIDETPNSKGA